MRIHGMLLPATVVLFAVRACVSLAGADEADENTELTAERYQEVIADLDRLAFGLGRIRAEIDGSQFDAVAVADGRDYDAGHLIEFVEREIAFEAYPGLLRGARGTLMSRAGNALDQSVLLAGLAIRKNRASAFRDSQCSTWARGFLHQMGWVIVQPLI